MRRTFHEKQKTPIIDSKVVGNTAAARRSYPIMKAKYTKPQCQKRSKVALLKDESLSRALGYLHKAEQTLTAELVKIGNCGSPIETDAGWLVLTH